MVAQQIANAKRDDLVLVHGAGSFGHPQAAAYLSKGRSISDAWKTHRAVSSLNTLFINELHSQRVPALPIHPLDSITPVSYTHLRAHETRHDLVCRLLLE